MTDNWRGFVAYYAVLVAFTLTAVVVIGGLLFIVVALAEWAVNAVMWLADNPGERDLATIGVLALLALLAGEYRRKR
ncbi:MAG: hypothetical protein KDI12_14660 [Anaerolineae bacterium]|nr:hypothetical protein [Anaerolineae bacterium]